MRRRRVRILLLLLLPAALLYGSAAMFGSGARGWFSPDTLEFRSQTEFVLFSHKLPLYRGRYETRRLPLAEYVVAKGHWSPSASPTPRWTPMYHWNRQWHDGHTRLCKELTWYDDQWIAWTDEHPDAAKAFWPMVLSLLREQDPRFHDEAAYLLMLGRTADSIERFDELSQRYLGRPILPTTRP
jgi:hypothetical protein